MKRLIGCMVCALAIFNSSAADLYNVLVIDRTDGVREHVQLDNAMVVKFLPEMIRISHPEVTVDYDRGEVARFSYSTADNPKAYDGDHQSSIDEVSAPDRSITVAAGYVTVGGTDPIVIYDMRGVEVLRAESDGTAATLHTASLPKGVYIVKSGSLTLKLTR